MSSSEGVGGAFGGRTMCNTAPHQELLDCTHSEAQNLMGVRVMGGGGARDRNGRRGVQGCNE